MSKKKFSKLREWNRRKNYFFKSLRMDIARILHDHKKPRHFDLASVKQVLFLRDDDKIGDMVVSTSLFREFGKAGFKIDVLAGKNNASVIEHNPYIRRIVVAPGDQNDSILLAKKLARHQYDLVVDMGDKISPARLRFIKSINSKNVIGFNKSKYNIYNKSLDYLNYDTHITARYSLLLDTMQFKDFSTDYDLHCTEEIKNSVGLFFDNLPGSLKIVINPFAADTRRDLSISQLEELVRRIKEKWSGVDVIIIGMMSRISCLSIPETHINPFNSLSSAIEIIRRADLVISPDTSIVHIATAWKKPLVCLYGNDVHGKFINSAVWGPGNTHAVQLFTKDKDHLISSIAVNDIISSIEQLI